MTQFSGPFSDSEITTELQWSRMARRWGADGVHSDDINSTVLKVSASGTSNVTVAAGEAFVNGFYYSNDASLSVPVTSNSGSASARVDMVVLRCDQANNIVSAKYKTGGTSAPTLATDEEGVYEIPLAQCTVLAGGTTVANTSVVDKRWFVGRPTAVGIAGQRRPPTKGQFLTEGKSIFLGNGTGWDWVATAGGTGQGIGIILTNGFATDGAPVRAQIMNGWVFWSGRLQKANGSDIPDGVQQFGTCPAGLQPTDFFRYGICPTEYNTRDIQNSTTNLGLMHCRVEVRTDRTMWVTVPNGSKPSWFGFDGFSYPLSIPPL